MVQLSIGVALLFISLLCWLQYRIEFKTITTANPDVTVGEIIHNNKLNTLTVTIGITAGLGIILLIWGMVNIIIT